MMMCRQNAREVRIREAVGPVLMRVKETAGASIKEHEGLSNFAEGLKSGGATRYVKPMAALQREHEQRAREAEEEHAKIVAAEAAWQASGGKVIGEEVVVAASETNTNNR